jgi:hypothetical protein
MQAIAQLETKLEIQDMSGAALRSAIAKLEVYSIASAGKAEEADAILMALDRDLTVLKANVGSLACCLMPDGCCMYSVKMPACY